MLKNIRSSLVSMKSRFNLQFFLDLITLLLVFATFFSIPFFSFNSRLYIITWILTGLMVVSMSISLIFISRIKIDIISFSFILFAISSLISSALSQFTAFKITAPVLSFLSFVIYSYCKSNSHQKKKIYIAIYLGDVLFALAFAIMYRKEIIGLDFSRLGSYFGDINDVSLFMGVGFLFSFYYIFFSKKIILKIINVFFCILFLICGITTGSKIFIFSLVAIYISVIFLFFGKKKWWLSSIIVVCSFVLAFFALQLPALQTVRRRLLLFFNTVIGYQTTEYIGYDLSTISRLDMFLDGIEMFMRKPLFGWGIWGFATYGGMNNGWSHNHFSETLCNFGIIGTVLFHIGFFKSFIHYFKSKRKDNHLPFLIIVFFVVLMFSVALNSEKIYSYLAPVAFCSLCEQEKSRTFFLFAKGGTRENKNS